MSRTRLQKREDLRFYEILADEDRISCCERDKAEQSKIQTLSVSVYQQT